MLMLMLMLSPLWHTGAAVPEKCRWRWRHPKTLLLLLLLLLLHTPEKATAMLLLLIVRRWRELPLPLHCSKRISRKAGFEQLRPPARLLYSVF